MLEEIKRLESSQEFREHIKKNPDIFLAHVFYMFDEANKGVIQAGYYSKKKDTISTFIIEKEKICFNCEDRVFREQKTAIKPLDLSRVKIDVSEALEIADKMQKEKYPVHVPLKKIAILQHLPAGQVWNITFLTQSFKTLNIKIDSETKKIISENLVSIISQDSTS